MKKLFCLLLLVATMVGSALAQKSYVNIVAYNAASSSTDIRLTGDVPPSISQAYYASWDNKSIGDVMNMLAKEGFVVEQMSCVPIEDKYVREVVIMSRSGAAPSNSVEILADKHDDAVEKARYNIQGLPVRKDEKGVQIVVYSDYSAKTVIVE